MNQRGNYKHQTHTKETHIPTDYKYQTHSKETHIPTDYKHQTHSKITSTKLIYPQIGAAVARRRWRSALFVLREEERIDVWVLGESDGKKEEKKRKEKGMYTQVWCSGSGLGMGPQKVEKFE